MKTEYAAEAEAIAEDVLMLSMMKAEYVFQVSRDAKLLVIMVLVLLEQEHGLMGSGMHAVQQPVFPVILDIV